MSGRLSELKLLECDTLSTAYSRHVDGVTAAMDEQAQVTGAILSSMQRAADGVSRISTGLDDWTIGMEKRRAAQRTRVLLRAAIHLPDGARIACSIRDLTEGGARLQLGQPAQVPGRFAVVVAADGRWFDCAVRHRSGTSLNVQFLAQPTDDVRPGPPTPSIKRTFADQLSRR